LKLTLADTQSGYDLTPINNNFQLIESEFQNKVLYRDNPDGEPNHMENPIDMNGYTVYNLPDAIESTQAVPYRQLNQIISEASSGLIARLRETRKTAAAGQTLFNLADITYTPGVNNIQVYVNGVAQVAGIDFEETNSTSITFLAGLAAGDVVDIYTNESTTNITDPVAQNELNKRVIRVSSMAELEGMSLDEGVSVYLTDDLRYGDFLIRSGAHASDPQKARFIDLANGNYAERVGSESGRIQARWFGLKGDGTDELAVLRDLASYATNSKRGVDFEPNKTYKYSDYVSFFDAGVLDLKESLVIFEHTGNSTGLQLKGQTGIINSRHQNNGTPSGTLGPAGQRDIVALDVKHTEFRNIKFVSGSNNYAPFNILGNSYNIEVDDIEFESAQWDMGCICHWATVSDSAAVDFSADIAFSPGVGNNTTHPHNIRIGNIKGNSWTDAGSLVSLVFLSGCYDVTVDNPTAEQINNIFTAIAGDYANEFAPIVISQFVNSGISCRNPTCHQITGTKGIHVSGQGVLTSNRVKSDVQIFNPTIRSTTAGTRYGVFVDYVEGASVVGGTIIGFSRSIFAQRNILKFNVEYVTCKEATDGGILSDSDINPNYGVRVIGCKIFNNNTSAGSALGNSGISLNNTLGASIIGNTFGLSGVAEGQQHSVYVSDGCDNISLQGNHTYSANQSSAYHAELVTQYSMDLWDAGGNTSDTAFTTDPAGHVWYQSIGFGRKSAMLNTSATVPVSGTWQQGDEVIFRFATAGGYHGARCTTGGTPGTWKRYGAIGA